MSNGQCEDATPSAVFTYGTLRADFKAKGGKGIGTGGAAGDAWGVCVGSSFSWQRGSVAGFGLYQQINLKYPYAVRQAGPVLHGTLLQWSDAAEFEARLAMCDSIEGYTPGVTGGLYERSVVQTQAEAGHPPVLAYIYHQQLDQLAMKGSLHFQEGDWLQAGAKERAQGDFELR